MRLIVTNICQFSLLLQSLPIRQFLLTNLVRSKADNTLQSRVPLETLCSALDQMADFPYTVYDDMKFEGPSLFLRGTRSRYVKDKSIPLISHFFPKYRLVDIESGHWLISEKPEEFKKGLLRLILFSIPSPYGVLC